MSLLEPAPAVEEYATDYIPEVVVVTEEVLSSASTVSTDVAKSLDASPVSALKRIRLEDLNAKAKEPCKKKYNKMKESFKMKFAEAVTTGQDEEFWGVRMTVRVTIEKTIGWSFFKISK